MLQRVHLAVILITALVFYLLTMPRSITLEDAGLFQMVCHLDGISHPPGYPLFTMLCNAMTISPSVVIGNLVSVVFAVCTILVFYQIVLLMTTSQNTALIATMSYSLSATFWSQAIIIEVYSLAALMFMLCWWLLLKFSQSKDIRYWFVLCLTTGLAISNHWPLFVLSCLGLLSVVFVVRSNIWEQMQSAVFWIGTIGLFLLGLAPYLLLLTNQNPEIAVFGPVSAEEFINYVSRSYYNDSRAGAVFSDKIQYYFWLVPESLFQFGLVAAPVILVGLYRSFKQLYLEYSLSLVVIFLSTTYLLMTMLDLKFEIVQQAIFRPYALIAYSSLAIWLSIGTIWLLELVPGRYDRYKLLAMFLLIVSVAVYNYPKIDRGSSKLVDEYARIILESLPADAILFLRGDNEIGPVGFLNRVEGVRSDVTLYDRDGLVFSNRLAGMWVSQQEVEQATSKFIKAQSRPVFSIRGDYDISTNHGLYYSYNNLRSQKYEFLPEFESYLDYLLELHDNKVLTDLHEQQFVYNLLVAFARQYARYSLEFGVEGLEQKQVDRMQRLQSTFPGKLATLEAVFFTGARVEHEKLLELAEATEQQITDELPKDDIGIFYGYFGSIMLRLDDKDRAARMFEESLRIMPSENNNSICPLKSLYKEQGDNVRYDSLEQAFSSKEC